MFTVATYDVPGFGEVDVVEQTEDGTGEPFYDLFDSATGQCLNEGNIFWEQPDERAVRHFVTSVFLPAAPKRG